MSPEPASRHPRVILHFGPPKTGTSALQAWCAVNRALLARHRVYYAGFDNAEDPKHQWLLREFRQARFDRLAAEVAARPDGTLVLSCEGVLVHRATFPVEAWPRFRAALGGAAAHLFLVQRDPLGWTRSLWKQGVLNPPQAGRIPVPDPERFGRQRWLAEMTALPDLASRLAKECGAEGTMIAAYESDWLAAFRSLAQLPDDPGFLPLTLVNDSAPDDLIALYRSLAVGEPDVSELRLVLFACFCRAEPTANLMLRSVARRFAAQPQAMQARQLDHLAARLAGTTGLSGGPDKASDLPSRLAGVLADRRANRSVARG